MLTETTIQAFMQELDARTFGDVRTDAYSKMLYSTDASMYQIMPHGVLIPKNNDDVHAAVELAAKHKMPILPRTAGSSLAGQAVNEALVIDFTTHLDEILEVNTDEHWVRLQPGRVLDELDLHLKPMHLQFGPDPASSNRAAMGGIVSNNSTGSHSIVYGMTADHILEATVILADGTITTFKPLSDDELRQHQQRPGLEGQIYQRIDALTRDNASIIANGTPRHWRRCGGYNLDRFVTEGVHFHHERDTRFNLANLICGGEGTLGVITELKLNLVPTPTRTAVAVVHFDDLFTALKAVPVMLEVDPTTVELIDQLGLRLCRDVPEYARLLNRIIDGSPNCVLITEFYGESEAELRAKIDRLQRHLEQQSAGATNIVAAIDRDHVDDVWFVRKAAFGLMMGVKGDHKPLSFIEDSAVPVEHLAEYVIKVEEFCHSIGTEVSYYAHASAGCVHIHPLVNTKAATEIAKMPDILDFSVDLLHGYGGSLSSEHGDGKARSWLNKRFFGPELYSLYQDVKHTFDPENILNPGNVVDAPSMEGSQRFGEAYHVIPIQPKLDFSGELGFDRAVEMCSGMGVCRKMTGGTMCPSFMVTRDEEHSTRGRANALRAAMAGVLPPGEFTSKRMYDVMDLCVSCKACKAECPSAVDMGKIKVEFLAQYHEANGTPLRTRMFGHIASLSRLSSGVLAPLANMGIRNPIVRNAMERFMGISSKRTLPTFAWEPFTEWFEKHREAHKAAATAKPVVLFNDTFNTYNYPNIAIAATEVLEKLGYAITLPGHGCCGRPMISKGLVDDARAAAQDVVDKLAPYARQGIPIVGLEPSCLLTLREEYLYLLPDDPDVQLVADHAFTFEEFIVKLADEGELNVKFTEDQREILLHGHCHQKALVGTVPSKRLLSLPPNYTVKEVDSGCCGMAGSFGYEAEHYDISIKMAERRLLPAVREAGSQTIVVAAGVSCRQQIKHGTDQQALHPAEVLRDAILN